MRLCTVGLSRNTKLCKSIVSFWVSNRKSFIRRILLWRSIKKIYWHKMRIYRCKWIRESVRFWHCKRNMILIISNLLENIKIWAKYTVVKIAVRRPWLNSWQLQDPNCKQPTSAFLFSLRNTQIRNFKRQSYSLCIRTC